MLLSVIAASAKDIKTVVFTTNPVMHCENCENKIKGNLRFEKGVKSIETNVEEQHVTVKYDADKTDAAKLQKAFSKFGYTAEVVACDGEKQPSCCQGKKAETKEGCNGKKKQSCCQAKKAETKEGCNGEKKQSCRQAKKAETKEGCNGCK